MCFIMCSEKFSYSMGFIPVLNSPDFESPIDHLIEKNSVSVDYVAT